MHYYLYYVFVYILLLGLIESSYMNELTDFTSKFYKGGFFGFGEVGDFKALSLAHFLPIIITIVLIVLIYKNKEAIRNSKYENVIRLTLGLICLFAEFGFYWRLIYSGSTKGIRGDLLGYLPIQVCQWSCIFAVIMMLNKNEFFFQHCCYVCLTLGLIPLATPVVITMAGPTYFRYYQYWFEHLVPIISVFYMYFVHEFKPKKKGMLIAYFFLYVLVFFAIKANNAIEGVDYLYLMGNASLAAYLPNDQYLRIIIVSIVLLPLFFLIYYLFNKKNNKHK